MRRLFLAVALLAFATDAFSASPLLPGEFKYEMSTCPPGTGTIGCVAPPSCTAGTCTAAVPTGTTAGMALNNTAYFTLTVCAATGQTLLGAGSMDAYVYKFNAAGGTGAWTRAKGLDKAIDVTSTSCAGAACQCDTFADVQTGFRGDRIRYVPDGVTVSGGTSIDVILEGQSGFR